MLRRQSWIECLASRLCADDFDTCAKCSIGCAVCWLASAWSLIRSGVTFGAQQGSKRLLTCLLERQEAIDTSDHWAVLL